MKKTFLLSILFLIPLLISAQTLTSSNLPIIIIKTDTNPYTGQPYDIPDNPKVLGNMKVIYHSDGTRNYMTDQDNSQFLNYNGRIGIELRGSSSQTLDKKPYGLKTVKSDNVSNNNVSILGLPSENDWVLYAIGFDQSLMRSFLSYELSRSIGQYAPRCVYCELVINNDYKGLYVFMEKIKIDESRVNLVEMTKTDNSLPELSGGYITKADKNTGGDPVAWTMESYTGTTAFINDYPKPLEITTQQNNYINSQFTRLQSVMDANNASITDGFPSVIDVSTFVDYMIMSELTSNADSYQYSTYFHKDRNGKLRAGPIWDYDLTFGNDLFFWNLDRSHTDVWQFDNGDNTGARFWRDLYNNPVFKCQLSKRWKELNATNGPLYYNTIVNKIDQIESLISEAVTRENARWHTLTNHQGNIYNMKSWLFERINFLNQNLSKDQDCANPTLPPLVISKINYNPLATLGHLSNDIEFIEITNNGNQPVDLTGIYLRELGISYQFPENSTLAADGVLYLASNATAFQQLYGFTPFGQYTRHLSNRSQKLVLANAMGNIIDEVEYKCTEPWPLDANANGYYLTLIDINADNSQASSWTVSSNIVALGIHEHQIENSVTVYPNPAQSEITVDCGMQNIAAYEIFDLRGSKVQNQNGFNSNHLHINLDRLQPDIYLLKLTLKNGSVVVQKINKLP